MSTTFAIVTFAWIFFRADGMHIAIGYIKQIGVSILEHPGQLLLLPEGKMAFVYIIPLALGDWYLRRDERILIVKNKNFRKFLYVLLMAFCLVKLIFNMYKPPTFIYFQF